MIQMTSRVQYNLSNKRWPSHVAIYSCSGFPSCSESGRMFGTCMIGITFPDAVPLMTGALLGNRR